MGQERHIIENADDGANRIASIFGNTDQNVRALQDALGVSVSLRAGGIVIEGAGEQEVHRAEQVIAAISRLSRNGWSIDPALVEYLAALETEGSLEAFAEKGNEAVFISHRGRPVYCRTLGQMSYVSAMRNNELTFGIGPAGTGKTYLAMALAVRALKEHEAERLILTRPAVEAGEKLGFLPGDFTQKVDPYLRPLFDAMIEMMGAEACQRLQERGVIEVAPLAYMRGWTLSDAFIILDEAQNTTREQMKMFLTRIGARSRVVVTGDPTQVDLPKGRTSGLDEAVQVLAGIEGIQIVRLTHRDVVRHSLVQRIVQAYEQSEMQAGEVEKDAAGVGAAS